MGTNNIQTFKIDTSNLATQDPSSPNFFRYLSYTTYETIDTDFKVCGAYYQSEKIPGIRFSFNSPLETRHLIVIFDPDAVKYIQKHQIQQIKVVLIHTLDRLLEHLPEYNELFITEFDQTVGNPRKWVHDDLKSFNRISGLPFGYYLAGGGIGIWAPYYINHDKIIYTEVFSWDTIEKEFPVFKKFVQTKKIDYSVLSPWYWGKQLDCKAMQNYLAITPMLTQICIKFGLKMFYYSQQSCDRKLSDELCDQMVTEDIKTINYKSSNC